MINRGTQFKTRSHGRMTVGETLAAGGQGTAFDATADDGSMHVLKVYRPEFQDKDSRRRLETLISQKFQAENETIVAPRELVEVNGTFGHISTKAPGISLEDMLTGGGFNMLEGIQIGCALARSISVIHQRGYAHGDIHANNVLVFRNGVCRVFVIDYDNFAGKSLPIAPCLGHNLYMAPEIRTKKASPSIEADRFSLAVVIHELLTLRHPVPSDASEEEFNEVMAKGTWLGDPACSKTKRRPDGYPAEVLDADLGRLFRLGISKNPTERPTAQQWQDALYTSLFKIDICPSCSAPNIVDASKKRCAICRKDYPMLALHGSFGTIRLDQSSVVIGRDQLGGSTQASKRHAVIRRIGPEYRIEDCSSNGVFRKTPSGWLALPKATEVDRQPVLNVGDKIRFANVECSVKAG
ncbi:MAG: protein kinase [Planctomycetota bacterium]